MTEETKTEILPEYFKLLENGNVSVSTKEGEFEIEEMNGETFDSVERIASKTPGITDFTKGLMLVSKSMVKPKVSELDLKSKYKLSTLKRLIEAVNLFVDESKSFLLTTPMNTKLTPGKL